MKLNINILLIFILVGFLSCNPLWEEHYDINSETIEMNIWEALQNNSEVSSFVQELESFNYDSLFMSTNSYTLFIPSNAALESYKNANEVSQRLLNYLITPHFIQSENINGKRKIQTLGQKFILLEYIDGFLTIDGVQINSESPLYRNGKYFIINEITEAKPNLYEYYAEVNPILKAYIDDKDSLVLDKLNSVPIGYNDDGQIVYDTVANIFNTFEAEYFPVRQESRYQSATIVFPKAADYNSALNDMAINLNSESINDYEDIPLEWQNRILLPFLLNQGIFPNMLEQEEFLWTAQTNEIYLRNILGDTILISYKPVEKTLCSNGYAYNYESFYVPDSLYMNPFRYEGEWLLRKTGVNKHTWNENITVNSDQSFIPQKVLSNNASNDSIMSLVYPQGYDGNFSIEFEMPAQFPREYILVFQTNMYYGGIYDIYVNDELKGTFDYYDFIRFKTYNYSSVTGERYFPVGNFNKFDVLVDNVTTYSTVKIKLVYTGPGESFDNGLIIDYVSLEPYW